MCAARDVYLHNFFLVERSSRSFESPIIFMLYDWPPTVPFFLYTEPSLNHAWLASACTSTFEPLYASAHRERMAEVALEQQLRSHPWRTHDPTIARLFVVALWEFTSWTIGVCNGTTHRSRMQAAADALRASPHFRRPRAGGGDYQGFDHLVATTGCIEGGWRARQRFGASLAPLLKWMVVGRDRAYSMQFASSAVGRCTIELPYPSNRHAYAESYHEPRTPTTRGRGSTELQVVSSTPRRWLVAYRGSLTATSKIGTMVRSAIDRLAKAADRAGFGGELRVVGSTRSASATWSSSAPHVTSLTDGGSGGGRHSHRPWDGNGTDWTLPDSDYRAQAAEMRQSEFCLIPYGDTETTSRLYTAIAASCLPVVIANQLSGAFASLVPYDSFWLRVEQLSFVRAPPLALLHRLRNVSAAERGARRQAMARVRADLLYDAPTSRVASNFLRMAVAGCLPPKQRAPQDAGASARSTISKRLGTWPPGHELAHEARFRGLNCSCVLHMPRYWFSRRRELRSSETDADTAALGKWPTELCRCKHCSRRCPNDSPVRRSRPV